MEQVHGNRVVVVGKKDDGKTIKNCDALITSDAGVSLSVHVADCLPIFVTDEKGQVFGVIHAGWRGLAKGIIRETLLLMQKELRMKNEELIIFIGPHICKKHYEVKDDVYSKFLTFKGGSLKGGRTFLDLGEIAKEQFVSLGVDPKNITIDPTCTFESKDLFSFRRGDKTDRNLYILTS